MLRRLALGLLILVLSAFLDDSFHSQTDLNDSLGAVVVGQVPEIAAQPRPNGWVAAQGKINREVTGTKSISLTPHEPSHSHPFDSARRIAECLAPRPVHHGLRSPMGGSRPAT